MLSRDSYQPRGQTPLLDAMGKAIRSLDSHIELLPKPVRPLKVMLVIVTDGQENASHEFSRSHIGDLLMAREKSGWNVQYLSSDLNAIIETRSLVSRESKVIKIHYASRSDLHLGLDQASARIKALLRASSGSG